MAIILRRPRDRQKLGEEVMAMRRRLLDSRSHRDGWFNVKDDVGGLIDFEFIIHYLVLGNAHAAADGYRTLRRMQHRLRLNGEQAVLPEGEIADVRKIIEELWMEVFGRAA